MKKAIISVVVIAALGAGGYGFYKYRTKPVEPTVMTLAVQRGDIADTVGATGTLQAVTTVQIGTQVSGMVQELYADFNSLVKKGQLLARLDPSTIETQIEQAKANLTRGEADLERLRVTLEDSRNKLRRAQELAAKQIVSQTDLEAAQVAVKSAEASLRSSEAGLVQSQASLRQLEVNLGYTRVMAPIDGLIISRSVDRGQTVQASMNAPTLFILAADLTKMQLLSNIDESDVGRIRPGQHVGFRVDAFPTEEFEGVVSQVRLNPIVQQGVVSYATVIDVENPQLKLKPGMTANVNIEINRRSDVVRVPNAALRFRPTNDMYAALGQPVPEGGGPGGRGDMGRGTGGGRPAQPQGTAAPAPAVAARSTQAAPPAAPPAGQVAGNQREQRPGQPNIERRVPVDGSGRAGRGANGESGGWQNLSPEDRERMMQQRDRGGRGGRGGDLAGGRSGRQGRPEAPGQSVAQQNPEATTIDALFGPLPVIESRGRVWLYANKQLTPVNVRLGITDGQATELLEGDVQPGNELVTNVITAAETTRPQGGAFPPFMGGQGGRGGPGGQGNQGGGNRGGGGGGGNNRGGGGR